MNIIKFRSESDLFFFKISVTPADILAGTNIDFGAPKAGAGKSWLVISAGGKIATGMTNYDNAPTYFIIAENTNQPQFTDGGRINTLSVGDNFTLNQRNILSVQNAFTEDGKIYLQLTSVPTTGDFEFEFFVVAQKINFIP